MGPAISAGGGGSSIMGDMMGLGMSMAAMNTMMPQMQNMMQGMMPNTGIGTAGNSFAGTAPGANGAPVATDGEQTRCPNCGSLLPAHAKFCLECGTKIEVPAPDEMICPKCGKKTPKGKFCMECGSLLADRCPGCGAEVPQGGKFCLECGTKLG
ncbi:MAG: zinc ribbon domain-containing protein [Eubacteriales bacterium]|nr:zinc ribbon domain-containing protein [Eubacteriales bacterium]